MYRHVAILSAALVAAIACDRRSEVQRDTEDLREAQREAPRVTQELQQDLENAKAEVIRLEEQLALARQGITDEVISERNELEQSLKEQQQAVQGEINEAKRESHLLSRDSEQAARQLEQTRPPARVEANLETETEVVEQPRAPVETIERREVIPVRGTIVMRADAGVDAGSSRRSAPATSAPRRGSAPAPSQAPAPSNAAMPSGSAPANPGGTSAPMPPR